MGPPPPGLWHRAVVVTTRVPPKVRLDGDAKLAASLLAQPQRLNLAVNGSHTSQVFLQS